MRPKSLSSFVNGELIGVGSIDLEARAGPEGEAEGSGVDHDRLNNRCGSGDVEGDAVHAQNCIRGERDVVIGGKSERSGR